MNDVKNNVVAPEPSPPSPEFNFPSLPPSPPPDNEQYPHCEDPIVAKQPSPLQAPKIDRLDSAAVDETSIQQTQSNQANKQYSTNVSNQPDNVSTAEKTSLDKRQRSNSKSPARKVSSSQQQVYKGVSHHQNEMSGRQHSLEKERERLMTERERKRLLEEEPWIPYQDRVKRPPEDSPKSTRQTADRRESRSRNRRKEEDEICEKCHHRKGRRYRSKSSDTILNSRKGT